MTSRINDEVTCPKCHLRVTGKGTLRCPRCYALLFNLQCQGNCKSCGQAKLCK